MNQSRTVRLPIHIVKELNVYLRAAKQLSLRLDHTPTHEEIAEMIDKPIEEIRRVMDLNTDTTSLDVTAGPDEHKTSLRDTLTDEQNDDPAELIQDLDWQEHLPVWLDALETRHREIIVRRFGLMGHQVLTLEEVGEEVGLTRERVRQLQIEALRQLRRMIEFEHAD